jgi:uncharacterized protein YunC (DUF1805 family)
MNTRDVSIGSKKATGFEIQLPGAPLVLVRGQKGFVMCGFLNLAAADKFNQAAAIVRGVNNIDELLAKPVTDASVKALSLGIKPGMTGRQAMEILA